LAREFEDIASALAEPAKRFEADFILNNSPAMED
jgi:hypothetical protein